jgi:hypothetical protein
MNVLAYDGNPEPRWHEDKDKTDERRGIGRSMRAFTCGIRFQPQSASATPAAPAVSTRPPEMPIQILQISAGKKAAVHVGVATYPRLNRIASFIFLFVVFSHFYGSRFSLSQSSAN